MEAQIWTHTEWEKPEQLGTVVLDGDTPRLVLKPGVELDFPLEPAYDRRTGKEVQPKGEEYLRALEGMYAGSYFWVEVH